MIRRFIIPLLAAAAILAACAKDSAAPSQSSPIISVSAFPGYDETRSIGTPDPGKQSWEEGDCIFLFLKSTSRSYTYRLCYSAGGWNRIEKLDNGAFITVTGIDGPEEPYSADAYFAPSYTAESGSLKLKEGAFKGTEEFLSWSSGEDCSLNGPSRLDISFSRDYSRIRVSSKDGCTVRLVSIEFVPAGPDAGALDEDFIDAAADINANSFFYGNWPEGTDFCFITFDNEGKKASENSFSNRHASSAGRSYALSGLPEPDEDVNQGSDDSSELKDDDDSEDFFDPDDFTRTITVVYSASSATVSPDDILPVSVSGAHVTLGDSESQVKGVNVILKGTTSNGGLKLYNSKKTMITLDGADISSRTGAAINNQSKKRLYVNLKGSNRLADITSYRDVPAEEDCKGCFFSEGQMIFSGGGSLEVSGNHKHGIVSDQYLRVLGGNVSVINASGSALKANGYVRIDGGALNLNAVDDGIKSSDGHIRMTGGELVVTTSGRKGTGMSAGQDIILSGGSLDISVSGNGSKCIKADRDVTLDGCSATLNTSGDSFFDTTDSNNSNPACIKAGRTCTVGNSTLVCETTGKGAKCIRGMESVIINSGIVHITGTGAKTEGLDSKGALTVNGGELVVETTDDAINATGIITFNGGRAYLHSLENDAVDSNYSEGYSIIFNGGLVIANGADGVEEGLDSDGEDHMVFNGGTIMSSGGYLKWQAPKTKTPYCSQFTVAINKRNEFPAGYMTITDNEGNAVVAYRIPCTISTNPFFIISTAAFSEDTDYYYGVMRTPPADPEWHWDDYFYSGGKQQKAGYGIIRFKSDDSSKYVSAR